MARPFFRLFCKVFASQLVRATYAGALGRAPDPAGLAAYTRSLRRSGKLENLVRELASSDEARTRFTGPGEAGLAWEDVVRARADNLVSVAFESLLLRPPEPQALESYAGTLRETGDLRATLHELGFSREHREKLLRQPLRR